MRYKANMMGAKKVALFDMPSIKGDFSIGRGADYAEREGYERGYATGEKAGFEMGEKKAKVLLDKLEGLLKDLHLFRTTAAKEAEAQCVEFAITIARKILMKELTVGPQEIVKMTKEAIMRLERTGPITVKMNPALYDLFQKHKPQLLAAYPDIQFDVDPSVTQYGTVVMGPVEDVVTDLDEQLKNLIKDMVTRRGGD